MEYFSLYINVYHMRSKYISNKPTVLKVANANILILKIFVLKNVQMPDRHPKCLLGCLLNVGSWNIVLNRWDEEGDGNGNDENDVNEDEYVYIYIYVRQMMIMIKRLKMTGGNLTYPIL